MSSPALAAPPVQVNSADPASAPQGTISLDVAVGGSGFDSSAAVTFLVTGTTNPGGITVKNVTVVASKKLIATIEIADTAVVSNFDIQVQLSGGRKGKGTSLFAVLKKIDTDPCDVAGLDFPAFAYWTQNGSTSRELSVVDSTGTCCRLLQEIPSCLGMDQDRLVYTDYVVCNRLTIRTTGE
jgi:hypothetical protein